MRRRRIAGGLGALLVLPQGARAQRADRVRRIGLLSNNPWTDPGSIAVWSAFQSELKRLGWIDGQTVAYELRSSDSAYDQLPAVARGMVDSGVELIVVAGGVAAAAVRDATRTIPVVFFAVSSPLGAGLVGSLARPAGNLTGVADLSAELIGKRLQLLLEVASGARRIGYLTTVTGAAETDAQVDRAGAALGLEVLPARASSENDLGQAVAAVGDAQAWLAGETVRAFARSSVVAALTAQRRPAVFPNSSFVWAGGLLSYGANTFAQARRAAWFADRILRGSRPGDIPVEEPTQFELVVNLRVARAQEIAIPQSVLVRAEEVIE